MFFMEGKQNRHDKNNSECMKRQSGLVTGALHAKAERPLNLVR